MKIWKQRVPHLLLFLFAMLIFVLAAYYSSNSREYSEVEVLSDGWTVKYNDVLSENVNLSEYNFPVASSGDWIVMERTMPTTLPSNASFRIHPVFSVVRVYIDSDMIYEYGMEDYERGSLIGYGTRFFSLPNGTEGKQLKISFFVTEDNAFSSFEAPMIYDSNETYISYYGSKFIPLIVAITLIVCGLCISVVTFFLYFKSYSMERLFCIGILSLCIGCWSLCSNNLDMLLTPSLYIKVIVEYLSLFLVPVPLLLYFREDVERRCKRWESFTFYALLLIEFQMFIAAVICQFKNIVHLPMFLIAFQVLLGISVLFGVYLVAKDLKSEKNHKILAVGLLLLLVLGGRDLVAFNVAKYITASEETYASYLPIGALIFIVSMLIDFISEMRKQMYTIAENDYLEKIAYNDVLTGLYTRRKCEEIFEKIDSRSYEYAIYQFDLNNLKTANDAYGHEAGDELIKRFANILENVFSNGETIGRMGGDEFVVIVTDAYEYKLQDKLEQVYKRIDEENAKGDKVMVSVSAGYAGSKELKEPTSAEVYRLADKRMYEAKEEYYKKAGYSRRRYDNE